MVSSQEYLDFILKQLEGLGQEIGFGKMMGEYLLYYRGRLFGGIYDNRLLLKPVQPALDLLENPIYESPYPGARPMLHIKEVEDAAFLCSLIKAVYPALPAPKKKK
ncbi:competence protein TfoX [Streptococcus cristatus]|uniref:Competence protein TfoX n=1 Tax=Streptococcus cristatus TaxID=45634 RepID=A0A5B0DLI6_STRCR|nr:competence protein TfoX [Streptococcus cristatus]KAA0967328.1 competence protein TfoX [Streptococcus cristatus]